MNARDINQTFDLLALAEHDAKLKRSGKFYIGPCPFCGGTDRFNLKQSSDGWRWFCRGCSDGKYKTPIDYVMRRDHLDFKQALEQMGGTVQNFQPREYVTPPAPPPLELPSPAWMAEHWHEVESAHDDLLKSPQAEAGRRYLASRQIERTAWNIYLLGFAYVYRRPAIVIPWWEDYDTITAIKYRFIDELAHRDPGRRFGMASGSKPILYGMNALKGYKTLALIEGEANAISVNIAAEFHGLQIAALSFGSERGGRENILRRVCLDYPRVIVWADDPNLSDAIRASLLRPAQALRSPLIDGVKYDANAMLQKARLAPFLCEVLKTPTPGQ